MTFKSFSNQEMTSIVYFFAFLFQNEMRQKLSANKTKLIEDAIIEYGEDNLILMNIFMKEPHATRYVKNEKITWSSFFANIGILLCILMGFSFISIIEIIFHIFFGWMIPEKDQT